MQKAPGSHVVVMSHGEDIPDTTKQEAAELAVIHSSAYKAGTGAKAAVDTTEVKNIWKANGAKPGMVLYEVYTTVSTVVAVAASLAAWLKHNSFTKAALKAEETLALARTVTAESEGCHE